MRGPLLTTFVFGAVVSAGAVSTTIVTTQGQAQRLSNQQKPDKITVNTGEVRLDVVVRDKSGHLRKDLTAADFEIYEDGVRQEISSLQLTSAENQQVRRGNQQNSPNNSAGPVVSRETNPSGVSAVAFVFDRLTPDGRARATQAALAYLRESVNRDELFGVFVTDLSVLEVQPFTDNRELVKSALEKTGLHAPSLYTSTTQRQRVLRDMRTANNFDAQRAALELRMLETIEAMERDQQGDATTRGLLLIASALRQQPGRKAVIFFSEGMILPPSVIETFRSVINAANRNNVSFYTVDAAGLRTDSKFDETNKEIASLSKARMDQEAAGADPQGPMIKGLERNEDLLRLNPDSGLGQLADQTGGFLITDTNDLKGKLQKVDEDLHSYYLISYASKNQNYDGHFRRIEVKVRRQGLNVQSRKGYFAVKGEFASPVLSYEAPALAALEKTPRANSFPFYAGGFSFPQTERTGLAPVVADVPLSAFTFHVDQEKKAYDTDFAIVTLIKDQAGQVVDKLSKQYRLHGSLDKLEETKHTRALFYREADLAAGRYTLQTIAYDAPTGRASVRAGTIEVPPDDEGKLRLSDVIILKRAEPATAGDEKQSNPFHVGQVIVTPNLGESLPRSTKEAPFFFVVYPAPRPAPSPKLTIELRQKDRTLVRMPGELPKSDASGRIEYLAGLPLEKIPAGSYELRITVSDETTSVTRSVYFKLED
jgi:VWFA-related protein